MEDSPDWQAVASDLLAWYDEHKREMPWRDAGDPYATLVAEVMLQQTQVATVEDYFEAFMDRFPTVEALASADEEAVLEVWAGLGYYRRARHLHETARRIVADHDGSVPDDPDALLDLPGIGPYTAGAVASIAFERPEPALDGNAKRVLARLTGETGNVDRAGPRRRLEAAARLLLEGGSPADVNQGLMELGSLVCTPAPRCEACPLRGSCLARAEGIEAEIPEKDAPPTRETVDVAILAARLGDAVLLTRAPDDGMLAGTLGFPWTEIGDGETPAEAAGRLASDLDLDAAVAGLHGRFEYEFSHRTWRVRVVAADAATEGSGRWIPRDAVDPETLAGVHRRVHALLDEPVQTHLGDG